MDNFPLNGVSHTTESSFIGVQICEQHPRLDTDELDEILPNVGQSIALGESHILWDPSIAFGCRPL